MSADHTPTTPLWQNAIDALSEMVGRAASWLAVTMVAVGVYNAVARYLARALTIRLSSNAYIEAQWYMFSGLFLLGGAWVWKRDGHVRVDIFYGRLTRRGRALVDLLGSVLLLIPWSAAMLAISWPMVQRSWAVLEGSPDPGGLPRYPIKTVIGIGFALLVLQGLAQAARAARALRSESP